MGYGQRRADVVDPQRRIRIMFPLRVSGVISPGLRSHNFPNRIIICRGEYRRTVARRFADRTGVKLNVGCARIGPGRTGILEDSTTFYYCRTVTIHWARNKIGRVTLKYRGAT